MSESNVWNVYLDFLKSQIFIEGDNAEILLALAEVEEIIEGLRLGDFYEGDHVTILREDGGSALVTRGFVSMQIPASEVGAFADTLARHRAAIFRLAAMKSRKPVSVPAMT